MSTPMFVLSRRRFFPLAGTLALAGCGTLTPQQVVNAAAGDALTVANGLSAALKGLQALNPPPAALTPALALKIAGLISDVQAEAGQMQATATNTAAQPLVAQIEADVNSLVDVAATLPLPPPYSTALQAAAVLLPVMETAIGMLVPAQTSARARAIPMTPAQARQLLVSLAAK